ncbi:BQ5605_C011g06392 [Microbotryum silenes-dioicae]|uniref:Lon protease homolog n=1 Tax=Microbotryum silenes-dioicae TaxID=796604 RepID=A0A2X0LT69_9BASI|nr:BQ5605_C011g06392 [Microbotryum silenes-dioicae]
MALRSYNIPTHLPILPLPEKQVLYPSLVLSIQVVSKHSVALLQSVLREAEQNSGNKPLIIGVVPLKDTSSPTTGPPARPTPNPTSNRRDPYRTSPQSDDESDNQNKSNSAKSRAVVLHKNGVAARIVRLERLSSGGFIVVLEGLARIVLHMDDFGPSTLPFHETTVTVLKSTPLYSSSSLLESLQAIANQVLTSLSALAPLSLLLNRRLKSLIGSLTPETAPTLVDALIGSIPTNSTTGLLFSDRLAILSTLGGDDRVAQAIEILGRVDESLNLKKRIGDKVDQNTSRRQREYLLMQQLIAIRQELKELAANDVKNGRASSSPLSRLRGGPGDKKKSPVDDEDDDEENEENETAELEKKIKAKAWTEESRKVVIREFKRLKKSPPQGAEHGVIRNYVEWLLALPWNESTPLPLSRDFIEQARKKLDDDHYGLEKVKKRLLEWLAVLRLKQEQWEVDNAAAVASLEQAQLTDGTPARGFNEDAVDSTVGQVVASTNDSAPPPAAAPSVPAPSRQNVVAKPRNKGPILLLCGPPGTGKTSIAKSLASAMGRKFQRISLGGVRDEAEIRGHRRTYVAALPGAIAQALRKCGTNNPVILLDEIDKLVSSNTHGDPGAALLEVLDPEQNCSFEDHYLGIPLDLSSVLFIATANSLDTISEPLFDRMETIELSGYVVSVSHKACPGLVATLIERPFFIQHSEKLAIAKKYLIPKQVKANSLPADLLSMPDDVLLHLITSYTHEAGVRTLEREIGAVCRAKAVEYTKARDEAEAAKDPCGRLGAHVTKYGYRVDLTKEDIGDILGQSRHDAEEMDRENMVGVSTGLAYRGSGNGGVLHVETTSMPGHGNFKLTGQLGDVITESAGLALAWTKSHAHQLGIATSRTEDAFKDLDIHLHLPSGSIKKDGPSAGVAMVVAIVSLMREIRMIKGVAMTGEITLRGNVNPVGGIREKVLGAHRAGIRTLILPFKNRRDVKDDLPLEIQNDIEFIFVRNIFEALEAAFGKEALWRGREGDRIRDMVFSEMASRL